MPRKKNNRTFFFNLDLLVIYYFNYKNPSAYNIKSIL